MMNMRSGSTNARTPPPPVDRISDDLRATAEQRGLARKADLGVVATLAPLLDERIDALGVGRADARAEGREEPHPIRNDGKGAPPVAVRAIVVLPEVVAIDDRQDHAGVDDGSDGFEFPAPSEADRERTTSG